MRLETLFILLSLCISLTHAFIFSSVHLNRIQKLDMGLGDLFQAKKKAPESITVKFLPSDIEVFADVGRPLSSVAEEAGVKIAYKCKKGECGTCLVNIDNKWVKACQTTISSVPKGQRFSVTIRPEKETKKAAFFSPKSLVDGFNNNALGMAGFVTGVTDAADNYEMRMKKEAELAALVAAKKAAAEKK